MADLQRKPKLVLAIGVCPISSGAIAKNDPLLQGFLHKFQPHILSYVAYTPANVHQNGEHLWTLCGKSLSTL